MLRRSSPNKPADPARLASNEAFERAVVGDKVLPMCANDCCTMCHLFATHFVAGQDGFVPLERWIHVLRLLMLLSAKSNPQMTQNMQRLHCFQMCWKVILAVKCLSRKTISSKCFINKKRWNRWILHLFVMQHEHDWSLLNRSVMEETTTISWKAKWTWLQKRRPKKNQVEQPQNPTLPSKTMIFLHQ